GLPLRFRADSFSALYGCVTGFLWLVTTLFSPEYFYHARSRSLNRYWLFNLLTLGAVMGVFFSAGFRTTFLFFEVMSLTSYALVAHDESPAALRAAETYLAIAIIGGLAVLMGMLLLQQRAGTLEFAKLYEICGGLRDKSPFYLPGGLMIAGFGAKAGMYPLHIWLPKAHPVAPAPASALLSGILTKTGVFGVAAVSCNIFPGDHKFGAALLVFSAVTMLLGAALGVFSNDLKRTLACSSVSQIGFILAGVAMQVLMGDHNGFAVRGTTLHMLNHSLLKLVLFLAAGVVYMNRHELELEKIRGFGRGKPLFLFIFLMAALGICGVPFWNGYVSKTLLQASIAEGIDFYRGLPLESILRLLNTTFSFTGLLTVAYMTKLFAVLFVERGEMTVKEGYHISRRSAAALAASAALLPLMGCFPAVMEALAGANENISGHAVSYFAWGKLGGTVISVAAGVGIYFFFKVYAVLWPEWLDLENLVYRPSLRHITRFAAFLARVTASLPDALTRHMLRAAIFLAYMAASLPDALTRSLRPRQEEPAVIFSLNLLLVGAGLCIAILYVFSQAYQP
ncbi:MAG: complex I subunit 5 family protein, partial [Oscillospiraceae bacterium]|nr:complex I subunit 5 family protein [Oscillospiraceae bacterium]